MNARYVFVAVMALIWATTAQAQYRAHYREGFRAQRMMSVAPLPRPGGFEGHVPVPRHSMTAGGSTLRRDEALCENPGADSDAVIAACGRIIAQARRRRGSGLVLAFVHRGQAHEARDDHKAAIADFSEAIGRQPSTPGYFVMRATALEKSGGAAAADADFRRAAILEPTNQDALDGLKRIATRSATAAESSPAANVSPAAPAIAALASPAVASGASHGARVALVIGNGAYVNANALPNPPNDAHAIAALLRQIGFDVQEGENLDHARMESLMHAFLRKAQDASVVLLFYAGHGMQVDGKNYLVPVDAKLADASDLPFETIEIDKLLDSLGTPGHTNIILLDACRDNPLARSFANHLPATRSAAVATGLAAYSAVGTGTLIAYATAPGQTALDGNAKDSPFTASLLHFLPTPGLEIRQVLTRVRAEVASVTGNRQIPWDNSSLMGDVILVGAPRPVDASAH